MPVPHFAPVASNALALALAVLGLAIGAVVAGVAASYRRDRNFWPCLPRPHSVTRAMLLAQVTVAVTFYGLALRYRDEPPLLAVSIVESTLLVALLVIDLDLRLVPTPLVGALTLLALVSANAWPHLGLGNAFLGGAVGFVSFGALAWLGRRVFGAEVLGLGDVNLALAIGCLTGYPLVVATLALGIIFGGFGAGIVIVRRRGGLRDSLPYGPALVAATLIVLIHGNTTRPFL